MSGPGDIQATAARMDARRHARDIVAAIERARIQLATEDQAQVDIGRALAAAGLDARREVVLDAANRVDFMVGEVAVEAKVRGTKRAIWRQVERYAARPEVSAVVIATAVAFPRDLGMLHDKPILVASLSRGWL